MFVLAVVPTTLGRPVQSGPPERSRVDEFPS